MTDSFSNDSERARAQLVIPTERWRKHFVMRINEGKTIEEWYVLGCQDGLDYVHF